MRVVRNDPNQLVIAHRPWGYAIIIAGFAAIFAITAFKALMAGEPEGLVFFIPVLFCALFFAILVRPVRIIFDAPSNSVEIIKTWIHRRERVTHRIDELSHAYVQTKKTSKGFTQSQLQLRIPEGESMGFHEISDYKGGPHHSKMARIINTWLDSARRPT